MSRYLSWLALVITLVFAIPAFAAAAPTNISQTTASYKVTLMIGPVETMLTPDQAKGATSGEVMVPMMGMSSPSMSMTDQGQPVNYHLEVHLYDKTTNAVITEQLPTIWITDQATGTTRHLTSAAGMYDVTEGMSDFHVGDNVYLANGTYTIQVQIGTESTTFLNVAVSSASAPAVAPTPAPAALPQTGGAPAGALEVVGLLGLGLVGVGWRIRRGKQPR